jgi:hypothetical protein
MKADDTSTSKVAPFERKRPIKRVHEHKAEAHKPAPDPVREELRKRLNDPTCTVEYFLDNEAPPEREFVVSGLIAAREGECEVSKTKFKTMSKHEQRARGRYISAIGQLIKGGWIPKDRVLCIIVAHDPMCRIYGDEPCNCDAELSVDPVTSESMSND